ncbi:unnamed protein product [Symbiodinium microadriaticum]|nr:unnamed protein product [Symbiodinium microadriaticum]
MLLNRAEAICQSLGCAKVVIEAPSWSEPLQEWLSECGYEDLGGHMWPEEKDYMLLKPTLVMEFQKQLCPSEDTVLSAEPSSTVSTAGSAESHIGAEGSLNELLAELLGALRAEAENAPVPQAPIASSSEAAHLDSPSNGSVTDVIGALDGIHIDTVNCGGEGVSFSLCDTNSAVESEAASDSNRTDLGDDAMKGIISDLFKALHAEAVPADPDV